MVRFYLLIHRENCEWVRVVVVALWCRAIDSRALSDCLFRVRVYTAHRPWAQAYVEQLLCPQDWFSFWRLNCRLASYHALVTGSKGYGQEDKVRTTASVYVAISIAPL